MSSWIDAVQKRNLAIEIVRDCTGAPLWHVFQRVRVGDTNAAARGRKLFQITDLQMCQFDDDLDFSVWFAGRMNETILECTELPLIEPELPVAPGSKGRFAQSNEAWQRRRKEDRRQEAIEQAQEALPKGPSSGMRESAGAAISDAIFELCQVILKHTGEELKGLVLDRMGKMAVTDVFINQERHTSEPTDGVVATIIDQVPLYDAAKCEL